MKKILLSAFSCSPYQGSEALNGWSRSKGLVSEGFEVHTLTRGIYKDDIERHPPIANLHFHYIKLPLGLEFLYSYSHPTMYLYYMLWQWMAYRLGKKLQRKCRFYRVHHVSWGSIQQGSFLYKLDAPFIFGPAGGGQAAPVAFKDYFQSHWQAEEKREKVSRWLFQYNPACKAMLRKAACVLVSNKDTEKAVRVAGAQNVYPMLDAALPEQFFPPSFIERSPTNGKLKLLWVGRFLPRKGIILTLEVIKELKTNKDITLTIVGDGEMRRMAEEKYNEWGLQDTISFVGSVSHAKVREYYTSHDAFFFTSLRDSCPAQLVEAMAFGLPVITIDLHGQGQIINSQTGIKIPLTNPQTVIKELANSIVELSNNPNKYKAMSKAAYSFAKEQVWSKKINEVVTRFY